MKRSLLPLILLFAIIASPIYAHDLTDRQVESINTSMELGIWPDLIYLDYWIAVGDLEAPDFRPLIDTDKNGEISDEENELFLDKLQKDISSGGLRIVIDDRADLSFALYSSRMLVTNTKNAPVPIKINFEFLLDLERLGLSDTLRFQAGQKHTLDFWMTNTLPKPVLIKAFFAQGEGINIPYTPEQRSRSLMFKSGFWLKPREYNYMRLNYENTGTGPARFDRPATIVGSNTGKEKMLDSLNSESLSFWIILAGLGFAFIYGAVHALAPGHGKTLVGAYLIGSRGTISQAILLGLIVTTTHLSTVIIAGVLALTASYYVNQTALAVYLGMVSGLIMIIMGVWIFSRRLRSDSGVPTQSGTNPLGNHGHTHHLGEAHNHSDDEGHAHSHSHHPGDEGHAHGHSHSVATSSLETVSLKQILALGISGGLVPCPTAIVILLMAITIKKTLWGLFLILAFSLGLASVLITIGILMVTGVSFLSSSKHIDLTRVIRILSVLSPVLITLIGIAIIISNLINSGVIILNPAALP
ncbi:MAG: sulfite exporter TauE/SafE family protein [Planctomycetes bacterium]|nr:sulfite exporter TauE/SafE family protein [Planctomycetota bacterium]